MRSQHWLLLVAVLVIGSCALLVVFVLMPLAVGVYTSFQTSHERTGAEADYASFTTPLPQSVIDDICSKFEIDITDARCRLDTVVYAPDFFTDIKAYFKHLQQDELTIELVNRKLGAYLEGCESVNNDGSYRCWYDLRGDRVYSIIVYSKKNGEIYRIISNEGSS